MSHGNKLAAGDSCLRCDQ